MDKAVLRAFERELDLEVVCPNISGLMGAYGAALYAKSLHIEKSTTITKSELEKLGAGAESREELEKNVSELEKNVYVHSSNKDYCNIFRGTFIGKYVYTISEDTVKQFDMQSENELASLVYQKEEESDNETVTEYTVTAAPSAKAID